MNIVFLKHHGCTYTRGKYYFSYSTGNTHKLCYAMGIIHMVHLPTEVLFLPLVGWTTASFHH